MKAALFLFFCGLMLFLSPLARAASVQDLTGTEFDVYIVCGEELGNFCEQGKVKRDRFIFSEGDFNIQYFQEFTGQSDSGEYSMAGPTFAAQYDATKDFGSYEIDIMGISLAADAVLFGIMDIAFTTYEIVLGKDTTAGKAFFIGIKD